MSDSKTAGYSKYPSYKTSSMEWLGDVPEHWKTTTMRRYCRVFSGATPDRAIPNYWDGGTIPWIASGDVNLRRIVKARQFITEAGYNASSTRYISPGSLVLALAGQGRTKGMVATVECRTTCNQSLAAIKPSPQVSDYNFLAYYLESRYTDIRALVGDGLRDGLNLEHIRGIQTPLPPLNEQTAIVRYLDDTDQRIRAYVSAKERLVALLEEERQAVIHQAVTRGLDPNVRLKPSGVEWLGDVPEHWEIRRGKRLFSPRQELTKPNDIQLSATQAYGVIPQDEYEQKIGRRVVKISLHLEKRQHVEVDDFVISMRSFQGGLERAWATGCIRSSYVVLRPSIDVDVKFFSHLFKSQAYIQALQSTANFIRDGQDLNFNNFCAVDLPFPPTEEQRMMAVALGEATANIDVTIANARREIELMEEYRTRLIADVVTGKIDVRNTYA